MEATALPTIEQVCARARELPCSPAVLPQLMSALRQDQSTAGEIERIIMLDSALAAATLRQANSAFVAARERVGTVQQALLLLGHREVYRIASYSLLTRWEEFHHESLPWEPGDYTRHALCTALAAETMAQIRGSLEPAEAYTAGLLCDVGKLVLAYACAPIYPQVSACAVAKNLPWHEAEKAVFGFNHTQVGAKLLRSWNFPEPFAQAIECQDQPETAPGEAATLVALLHAARYIAVSLGPGVAEDGYLFKLHGDLLASQGYTAEFFDTVMLDVRERAVKRMGDRLSVGRVKPSA